MDLFGSFHNDVEPHDQADLTTWTESLFSISLAELEIDWAKDFDIIVASCNSDQCVTTQVQKLITSTVKILNSVLDLQKT